MDVRVPAFNDTAACHLEAVLLSTESRTSTLCRWQAATVRLAQALRVDSNSSRMPQKIIDQFTNGVAVQGRQQAGTVKLAQAPRPRHERQITRWGDCMFHLHSQAAGGHRQNGG